MAFIAFVALKGRIAVVKSRGWDAVTYSMKSEKLLLFWSLINMVFLLLLYMHSLLDQITDPKAVLKSDLIFQVLILGDKIFLKKR